MAIVVLSTTVALALIALVTWLVVVKIAIKSHTNNDISAAKYGRL